MEEAPAAASSCKRPRRRGGKAAAASKDRLELTASSTTVPFPLPVELLLHALDFLMGTHTLRGWRNAAEDLFSLRAASGALRAAVTEAALPRLEALLLAAERQKRAGLRALVHHAASCRARRPAAAAAVALPPVEQRRRLFLATEAIAVAGQGQGDAGGEQEGQLLALCPRGEYDRATDAFLRQPGTLESLPDTDLLALHARYGAGASADVRLPSTARPLPSSISAAAAASTAAAALPNEERTRLIAAIRSKLCPLGYVGLSCRAQRILAAASRERMPKTEAKARFGLTEATMAGGAGALPYVQEGYRATKLYEVWRLQAAAMRRHGSPAGLEAFLASKREAAAARRARLPLVGAGEEAEGDDMGWEGVGATAAALEDEGWR